MERQVEIYQSLLNNSSTGPKLKKYSDQNLINCLYNGKQDEGLDKLIKEQSANRETPINNDTNKQPVLQQELLPKNDIFSPKDTINLLVVIHDELIDIFIRKAERNTESNIETIGFIVGLLQDNDKFVGDTLIIPKQSGESDRCECDSLDVYKKMNVLQRDYMVAWIHTHPQHDQMLSSVDLHSQWMHQDNENIKTLAIVYAPTKEPQIQGYLLSELGINAMKACHKQGHHETHDSEKHLLYETFPREKICQKLACEPQVYDMRYE